MDSSQRQLFFSIHSKKNNRWLVNKIAYRSAGINCRKDRSVILIDSGILQPFISFEIEENSLDISVPIHPILNGCALPDVVIVFKLLQASQLRDTSKGD